MKQTAEKIIKKSKTKLLLFLVFILVIIFLIPKIFYRTDGYFEIQAHFAGVGEYSEHTINALENTAKSKANTIQLGLTITNDTIPIVWGDLHVSTVKCQDTKPAVQDDHSYPYVGKKIENLTYQQLLTLNCNYQKLRFYPKQKTVEASKILTLREVFEQIKFGKYKQDIALEIIDSPMFKNEKTLRLSLSRILYTKKILKIKNKLVFQSSNWDILNYIKTKYKNQKVYGIYAPQFENMNNLKKYREKFANSELTIIDIAKKLKINTLMPQFNYLNGEIESANWSLADKQNYIQLVHDKNLKIVAWSINSEADYKLSKQIGLDGIMTDYPNL